MGDHRAVLCTATGSGVRMHAHAHSQRAAARSYRTASSTRPAAPDAPRQRAGARQQLIPPHRCRPHPTGSSMPPCCTHASPCSHLVQVLVLPMPLLPMPRPLLIMLLLLHPPGGKKDSWLVDYQATKNVLDVAREQGASHFVLLSAICVQKPLLEFQKAKLKFEADLQVGPCWGWGCWGCCWCCWCWCCCCWRC